MAKAAAVIGSGPSGLLSAIILRKQGYDVTVYEKEGTFGGRVGSEELPQTKIKVEKGAMFVHGKTFWRCASFLTLSLYSLSYLQGASVYQSY